MDPIKKFLDRISYKFPKGYPEITNHKDVNLLESLISETIGESFSLLEKALTFNDVASESRIYLLTKR